MTSIPSPGESASPQQRQTLSPPPPPAGRAGWRPWTAWAAIVTGFGMTVVGGLVVSIVAASIGASVKDPSPGVNIGLTFFQNAALIAAALIFAHMAGRPRGGDFGLRGAPLGRSIGLLLAIWVGFYVVSAIWVAALSLDERQTLPDELGVNGSTLNLILVIVLITVIAPLGEELFFRGYFFGALRNWKGFWPAAIVTGLVFGAIHIGSAPIGFTVPLAFFGFGLCLLYHRSGSLYPCIALHALNNSVALGLTQKWSWEIAPMMVGSVIASLTLAWLLARLLSNRAERRAPPPAQPLG
ncbi:MAG: CPBP family intramembrane glutamic endopeptidase [Solirubrobacteraceae bacterium]